MMSDPRINRIIDFIANLNDEETVEIFNQVRQAKKEKREQQQKEAILNFQKAWKELDELDLVVMTSEKPLYYYNITIENNTDL